MLDRISISDIADLRAVLDDAGYNEQGLVESVGTPLPPSAASLPLMLHRTRQPTALSALARLFLIGASLESDAAESVLPKLFLDMCFHTGLLERSDGRVHASIVIVPLGKLLFASDAFARVSGRASADFVLPASTRAGTYLRHLTLRAPVESALDLGCGCGVHALLAASHSGAAVATDISESAIAYTEFNAQLNTVDNVQCLRGDGFEPVAGRQFDLIVTNPPFVVSPATEFNYRDNPLVLDEFCRRLVREAPAYLNDGGRLQMLCEWVEIEDEPWQERLADWVRNIGCDAWILRSPPRDPATYVSQRLADISGEGVEPGTTFDDWLAYFEKHKVRAIHPGMIVLQRRDDDNWFRVQSLVSEPDADIGDAVERNLAASDFLQLCGDDEVLLEAVLAVSPDLELEQAFTRAGNSWAEKSAKLRISGGLAMESEVDLPVLAFFNQLDGRRSVRECVDAFCSITGADVDVLTPQLLPAVRLFIGNGFIEAADADR